MYVDYDENDEPLQFHDIIVRDRQFGWGVVLGDTNSSNTYCSQLNHLRCYKKMTTYFSY